MASALCSWALSDSARKHSCTLKYFFSRGMLRWPDSSQDPSADEALLQVLRQMSSFSCTRYSTETCFKIQTLNNESLPRRILHSFNIQITHFHVISVAISTPNSLCTSNDSTAHSFDTPSCCPTIQTTTNPHVVARRLFPNTTECSCSNHVSKPLPLSLSVQPFLDSGGMAVIL